MSTNSSTTSKPTVTALRHMTSWVVSPMLLLLSTPLHQRAASRVQHPNHVAASSLSSQVARKGSTLSGFVQRSRLEREVGRDLHSNKWEEVWSCIRQSGQSGEGCRGSPMEKRYETRSGDLFVRSWARVRRVSLDRWSSAGETDGVWSWRTLLGGLWLRWLLTMWLCISCHLCLCFHPKLDCTRLHTISISHLMFL